MAAIKQHNGWLFGAVQKCVGVFVFVWGRGAKKGISVGGNLSVAKRVTTCNLFSTAVLEVQPRGLFGIQSGL